MKKSIISAAVLIAAVAFPSLANESINLDEVPKILKFANETRGWQILNKFDTDTTLTGWIVNTGQGRQVAYTDSNGFLLLGELVSPDGVLLNTQYLSNNQPSYDFEGILRSATFIDINPSADNRSLIVFFEPHCPVCSVIYAALKPYINAGHPVKFLPVSFLSDGTQGRPSSDDVIYSIMTADNPLVFLDDHESSVLKSDDIKSADDEFKSHLVENLSIMRQLGISGTPSLLIPKEGGGYIIQNNMVTMDVFPAIFNTKRMDSPDPRLQGFGSNPSQFPVE